MSDRPKRRRWRLAAAMAVALILAGVLLIYGQRQTLAPWLANWMLRSHTELSALGPVSFRIGSLGPTHLSLHDLALDDDSLVLEQLGARFSVSDLLKGRVARLEVRGLTVNARRREDGFSFGRLDALTGLFEGGGAGASQPPSLPFDRLDVADARLRYGGSLARGELPFALDVTADPQGALAIKGTLDARLALLPEGSVHAGLSIATEIDAAGRIAGRGDVSHLTIVAPDLEGELESGSFRLEWPPGEPPSGEASLSFATLRPLGLDLDRAVLQVENLGDGLRLAARLADRAGPGAVSISADLRAHEREDLTVTVVGGGDLALVDRLVRSVVSLPDMPASGRFDIDLSGRVPGGFGALPGLSAPEGRTALMAGATLSGRNVLEIALGRGEPAPVSLATVMTVGLRDGAATLNFGEQTRGRVSATALDDLSPALPAVLRSAIGRGMTVVPLESRAPVRITARRLDDGWAIRPEIAVTLKSEGGAQASLDAGVVLHLDETRDVPVWDLLIERAQLQALDLPAGDVRLPRVDLDIGGWLGPDGLEGRVLLDGVVVAAGPEARGRAELSAAMRVSKMLDGPLRVSMDRVGATARRIELPRAGVTLPTVRLASPADSPIEIRYSFAETAPDRLTAKGALAVRRLTVKARLDGEDRAIVVEPGRLGFTLATGANGRATVSLGDSRIDSDVVRLTNLSTTLAARLDREAPHLTDLTVKIARIEDGRTPVRFTPLSLTLAGRAKGGGGPLALNGSVSALSTDLRIPLSLTLQPDLNAGHLSIPATDIVFAADRTDPVALVPPLAGQISQVSGGARLAADLLWPLEEGAGRSSVLLQFDDVGANAGDIQVEGLDADIRLTRPTDPRTLRPVRFSARQLRFGVAIADLAGSLDLDGLEDLRLHDLSAAFAGGRIELGPVRYRPGQPISTLIRAKGLDGAALTALSKVEGLSMAGRLFGRLPVAWSPADGFAIADGRLGAEAPGIVRYRPDDDGARLRAAGGDQVALMLDALSNFHYTNLDMAVDGRPADGFKIGIALKGANPDLYDGHPLEFNLNLTGQLDDIIKTGYQTYALPERLGEALLRGVVDR